MSQPSSTQTLVFGAGNCVTWLDPSNASTLTHPVTPDHVTQITDLAAAISFTYGSQSNPTSSTSATPTLDSSTLPQPGLILSTGFIWTTPKQLADNQGQFTLFYVGGYNAHTNDERDTWLVASQPADMVTLYRPSSLPPTTTGGGIVLKRVGTTSNQFQLTFYDSTGHQTQSSVFTVPNYAYLLTIQVTQNGSGHPTINVRLNGQFLWSYDAGALNPDGLNFVNQQFTSFGVGTGMMGPDVTGEILVYEGVIANNSVTPIENYLIAKWVPTLAMLTIGDMTTTTGVVDQAFMAQLPIANAASVSVATVAAGVGSNWTAIRPVSGNLWTISGLFPPSVTNFALIVTATDASGTQVVSKTFQLLTTAAGTETAAQQLVYGLNPSLWLDPSDASTLVTNNGRVVSIVDKVSTSLFNISSSETPTIDSTSMKVGGLAYAKSSESASGFNYALTLSPTSRPDLFTHDPSVFTAGSGAAGTPMGNGLQITGSDGSYTLVMVIDYNGQVSGPPQVDLVIKNDFPDAALNYCVQKWGLISAQQGSTGLTVYSSDAVTDASVLNTGQPAVPNKQQATTLLAVGQPSVVVWRYDPTNGPVIRINGAAVSTTFPQGSGSGWHSVAQLMTQLTGSHAIGTQGELIAIPSAVSDTNILPLELALMNKWFISKGTAPTISTLSTTTQYATQAYTGTVTISNGGVNPITATISANAGTGWTITQDHATPTLWHIGGILPASAGTVSLTIVAEQDNATSNVTRTITSQALPAAPTIQSLTPLVGAINAAYTGTLTIVGTHENDSSSGLTVSSSHGSGWTIIPDPSGTPNLYQITGTLPGTVQNFTLTVTANDQSTDGLANNTSRRTFTLETTGTGLMQATTYQLDLTGLLPGNKITNETQVLTPENGPENQYLVPIKGPFFGASLVLQYKPTTHMDWQTAQPGSDYVAVGELQTLTPALVSPVFVGISVMSTAIQGPVRITYQTLGGNFVYDRQALLTQLADMLINQRQIDWSQVVNLPMFFPAGPHTHNADTDIVGLASMTTQLATILTNVAAKPQPQDITDMAAHMANMANPHQLHPADIQLGLVPNFPPATAAQAVDPTNTTTLLTPYSAALAAAGAVGAATATVAGMVKLNEGNAAGDDNNSTDGLTAAGLLALMTSGTTNQIKSTFVSGEQTGQISPYPMTFPLYWHGIQYTTLADFINAVETFVGVEPLPWNQTTGLMFFPKDVTVPSLVTTAASTATGTRDFTTEDPMSLPLLVPTGSF